jgi:hypothetical protein
VDSSLFYTQAAEWMKALFYLPLFLLVLVGYLKYRKGNRTTWDYWIHAAICIHFIVGAIYSGVRMLTTDPAQDMLIRRIFAAEAWFNFACVSFYFLVLRVVKGRKSGEVGRVAHTETEAATGDG